MFDCNMFPYLRLVPNRCLEFEYPFSNLQIHTFTFLPRIRNLQR